MTLYMKDEPVTTEHQLRNEHLNKSKSRKVVTGTLALSDEPNHVILSGSNKIVTLEPNKTFRVISDVDTFLRFDGVAASTTEGHYYPAKTYFMIETDGFKVINVYGAAGFIQFAEVK